MSEEKEFDWQGFGAFLFLLFILMVLSPLIFHVGKVGFQLWIKAWGL